MIKLGKYAKFLMRESMDLSIEDADYTRHDNMWDLSVHLKGFIYKILQNLPPDQIAYYDKNRPSELLVPDGTVMREKKGTLNLYYSGYTLNTLKEILKVIFAELKRLNVEFGSVKMEQSRTFKYKVIRIPILNIKSEYSGAPQLNMSNRNAYHIFKNVLQFEPDDDSGSSFSFTANELKDRIELILKHDPDWVDSNKINKTDSAWPKAERDVPQDFDNPHDMVSKDIFKGARVIGGGLSGDDIKERLYEILEIAEWAIKHNKQKMYVA